MNRAAHTNVFRGALPAVVLTGPAVARVFATGLLWLLASIACAENWPAWRGPEGTGVSRETELPIAWGESSFVVWKCPLPGWGNSTPVIWGDAIFVTSQLDDELVLLRIGKRDGKIQWTRTVGKAAAPRAPSLAQKKDAERRRQKFHNSQNLASPSPVTDGEVVVAHFGNGDLAAFDFSGKELWKRNLQEDHGPYSIWWGHANSPVLHKDVVVSVAMQDSCADLPGEPSPSYVVAHDKRTGQERWFTLRPTTARAEFCDSYSTPLLWTRGERTQCVVWGGHILDAYDPLGGKRLWELSGFTGNRLIPSPIAAHGMIYAIQGMKQPLVAVRPGGEGKRTQEDIAWKFSEGTSDSPSPVIWGELLFMVNNDGIVRCIEALSGRLVWKDRLAGEFRASPLAAEGRIYFLSTRGVCTVVAAATQFEKLAENRIDDETFASPAASDGRLYLRGRKTLYCLGK